MASSGVLEGEDTKASGTPSRTCFLDLSPEILVHTLGFLDPNGGGRVAQVCKQLGLLSNDKMVWKGIQRSLPGYELFKDTQDTSLHEKEKTKRHYLRVRVNAEMDDDKAMNLIADYKVTYRPDEAQLLDKYLYFFPSSLLNLLAAQNNQQAIERKMHGLENGMVGHRQDLAAARIMRS